jgi:glutamine synthetase
MDDISTITVIENSKHELSTLGVFDIDGVFRGKKISKSKLLQSLYNGVGFSDIVFGWDIKDCVYDDCMASSIKTGFSDVPVVADLSSMRTNYLGNGEPLLIGNFTGRLSTLCPRTLLRSVTDKYIQKGLSPNVSCEYEFILLDETAASLRKKNFAGLNHVSSSVNAYTILESPVIRDFVNKLTHACDVMNIPLSGIHPESGIGVLEAAIKHTDALTSADNASLFKQIVKYIAMNQGWTASFMSKLSSSLPGQGGHIHLSLSDHNSNAAFYDEYAPNHMSKLMCHFLGGVLKLMPELTCLSVPTVNGYKRLVPEYWAPILSNCGIEDRTCSIRVIGNCPSSLHLEYRLPGADMNPYISIAALLGSGLWGIENELDPGFEFSACGTRLACPIQTKLASSLEEATQLLDQSSISREILGEEFIDHFVLSRRWEYSQCNKEVSSWELDRYLERI